MGRISRLAYLLLLITCPVEARPSVFMTGDGKSVWWMLNATIRPMGKDIDGVTVEAINEFRSTQTNPSEKLCFIDPMDSQSYAATDRATQLEIDKTLREQDHDPFFQTFTTSDGRAFAARAGVEEECGTGKKGAILVIYEKATKKVADVTEWYDVPFRFLWPRKSPALLMQGQCFMCGDVNALYYDAGRKKFYWEYEGD